MSGFAIEARTIGDGAPTYVIAEIGVNHDGDVARGRELVRLASEVGADAVKFQLFDAVSLMSADAAFAAYQRDLGAKDPRAMLAALELAPAAMAELCALARSCGVHPIVTVFNVELVDAAERMGVAAYKSASPDVIHRPLLEAMSGTGRPLIVSTGAADLDEIRRAGAWLRGRAAAWLQCVSSYPTPDARAALGGMRDIRRAVGASGHGVVGYSDHTTSIDTGALAVAAGAEILEKHLTYDRAARGPDHAASLDPGQFAEYVRLVRRAEAMLGQGKVVLEIEADVRRVSRQSLVATRAIRRGESLSARDLCAKRPGTGIPPWRLRETVGRVAARDIAPDHVLREEDLA
ncbi:MAG: N-acetylneuraminate synthase family protein [Phycisphaerae bacterium]|nr:N-acetylneuraminate synthase family protein [Phycisphaerae bacterium]